MKPVLAGRNAHAVTELAERLGFEARIFSLGDPNAIDDALSDAAVVLHCAGPFTQTSRPMAAACLRTGTHYLDITGEIEVFQALHAMDTQAKQVGVMLLPGAGFDVVPSDCLAAHLKTKLPAATKLALAFRSYGPASLSRGTARTSIQNLGQPSYIRRGGKLTPVPHLSKTRQIDFGRGPVPAQRVKWGDVFTAYHTTAIPNIENYIAASGGLLFMLRMARSFGWLLRIGALKRLLGLLPRMMPPGPTDAQIESSGTVLWGEVQDDQGNRAAARLNAPEAYYLTALASLAIAQKVLSGDAPPGYQTPAGAYGPDWVLELEGVTRTDVV